MKPGEVKREWPLFKGWDRSSFQKVAGWVRPFHGADQKAEPPQYENKVQKFFFHLTSALTDRFPRGGAKFLDALVLPLLGHPWLVKGISHKNLRVARGVKQFRKILVIPDIHIGDAIMMQGAVQAFRDFFPMARIDYVVKRSVADLIIGNPSISHVYPRFTGTVFPTPEDIQSLQELVSENHYDLCFNASPFFEDAKLFPKGQVFLNFMTVAPRLMRNEKDRTGIDHFLHLPYSFIGELFRGIGFMNHGKAFKGVPVTLSDRAVEEAKAFLREENIPHNKPIIFLNPDTASRFTLIPFEFQARILQELLGLDCSVLLGACYTHQGLEKKLFDALYPADRRKVFLTPTTLSLEAYAALADRADVFISGDTGPLHLAAARKVSRSGNHPFRNRTFVLSVFGATPSRMSGYDSTNPLYLPANQDAPSKTYVSQSPCRNITCVNKMLKTCKTARCFEVLDVERMIQDIRLYLRDPLKKVHELAS